MRERVLKVVLILVGLFFTAAVIPTWSGIRGADPNTGDTMLMAIYATLGVVLLLAVRNPAAYRSVIAFAARKCQRLIPLRRRSAARCLRCVRRPQIGRRW